jgi:hypothetical protein
MNLATGGNSNSAKWDTEGQIGWAYRSNGAYYCLTLFAAGAPKHLKVEYIRTYNKETQVHHIQLNSEDCNKNS